MFSSCKPNIYRIPPRLLPSLRHRPPLRGRLIHSTAQQQSTSPPPPSPPQTIFSGIQPTGIPHLGNYLGALQEWVRLQDNTPVETKLLFSVVDLHAITVPQDRERLRTWRRECLASLLAVGLRPERCVVFMQSQVQAHAELMWILSCTASMGYLSRMTQWKSKLQLSPDVSPLDGSSKATLKLGLFSYPVLQAADILVHRATHVPVGEDQSQHLEFARECVTNFNHTYGCNHLISPQTILSPTKRVMSLTSPLQKMSKSDPAPGSRILITDSRAQIRSKIMSAVTDSTNSVSWEPEARPGVANLLTILSHFDEERRTPEVLGEAFREKGSGLGEFKRFVAERVGDGLEDVRVRFEQVLKEEGYLDEVERKGAEMARANAEVTMKLVRDAVGL